MNNFPIRVCWLELGEGQLGCRGALVYISRTPRSVFRKILSKSPHVYWVSEPLRGRAAFSNCHLLNLKRQSANKSTSSVSQTQIHIFWGEWRMCEKQEVNLIDTEAMVIPEHSQSIPLKLRQTALPQLPLKPLSHLWFCKGLSPNPSTIWGSLL